jgi:hypothetical protein
LKYNVIFVFEGWRRDCWRYRIWKASVIRSEIRSTAEPYLRFAFVSAPFDTNEIPRTNPLVQVDYVRVVDLDIGASKSDICAISGHNFWSAPVELEPATAGRCRNSYRKR